MGKFRVQGEVGRLHPLVKNGDEVVSSGDSGGPGAAGCSFT